MPSHVKSMYDSSKSFDNIASEAAVSASYTSQYDKDGLKHLVDGVVSYNDDTRNRWSNYANPIRTQNETITFDFAKTVTCASLKVHLYDDEGNTLVPKDMKVEEKKQIVMNLTNGKGTVTVTVKRSRDISQFARFFHVLFL